MLSPTSPLSGGRTLQFPQATTNMQGSMGSLSGKVLNGQMFSQSRVGINGYSFPKPIGVSSHLNAFTTNSQFLQRRPDRRESKAEDEFTNPSRNYVFGPHICQGSFGVVKQAINKKEEVKTGQNPTIYAIKIVKAELYDANEVTFQRMAAHTNVVQIHEAFPANGNWFLVLEYCAGGDLFEHVSKQPVVLKESVVHHYFTQMLDTLTLLHSLGMVHHDIKLENYLLMGDRETVKLCDFGAAEVIRNGALTTRYKGEVSAPEKERDTRGYDGFKADIWQLGKSLHELLFHLRQPKEDMTPNPIKGQQVGVELWDLLVRMLSRDPAARPSLQEIREHPWFAQTNGPRRTPGRSGSENSTASTVSHTPSFSSHTTISGSSERASHGSSTNSLDAIQPPTSPGYRATPPGTFESAPSTPNSNSNPAKAVSVSGSSPVPATTTTSFLSPRPAATPTQNAPMMFGGINGLGRSTSSGLSHSESYNSLSAYMDAPTSAVNLPATPTGESAYSAAGSKLTLQNVEEGSRLALGSKGSSNSSNAATPLTSPSRKGAYSRQEGEVVVAAGAGTGGLTRSGSYSSLLSGPALKSLGLGMSSMGGQASGHPPITTTTHNAISPAKSLQVRTTLSQPSTPQWQTSAGPLSPGINARWPTQMGVSMAGFPSTPTSRPATSRAAFSPYQQF